MNTAFPVLESEPRFFFVPRQHIEWRDARAVELVAHELERLHRFRPIHNHLAALVEYAAAERAEVFDECRDEALVARALPDDAVPRTACASHCVRASLTNSVRSFGSFGTRSVRRYKSPTSANHGSA
jgi:hypothetical protein